MLGVKIKLQQNTGLRMIQKFKPTVFVYIASIIFDQILLFNNVPFEIIDGFFDVSCIPLVFGHSSQLRK